MSDVKRISPKQAAELIEDGARLVAAYDSGAKFDSVKIENAIPLDEFRRREGELGRDDAIIFY